VASEVLICNRALQILGEDTIISLTDDSNAARALNLAYEPVRDAEMERRMWRFTIKRASLPALNDDPEHGYGYQYQPPADFLSLLHGADLTSDADLSDYRSGPHGTRFSFENGKILTDLSAPLEIIYKARVVDVALYPASFSESLSARLAYECCERITGSDSKVQLAERRYNQAIREARWANAILAAPQVALDDSWVMARTF
jgi:hypothetical protein